MKKFHDILGLQEEIIKDYKDYVKSFINIQDERIGNFVEEEIQSGKYWPEPLIQFNPSFDQAGPIDNLCDKGILHQELSNIFKGFILFKHQNEALEIGASGNDFILTSGTGSGKSLAFLGTIFNHCFSHPSRNGVKAIIVYPMNALINSQYESLIEFQEKYTTNSGKEFPIRFAKYTGQEKEDIRCEIRTNPPDILLTNYMMLELILTRTKECDLRNSISENLKILVFDELHIYRGRQGADISMLIRRIHSQTKNEIQCIGTSATMVSGSTIKEQKLAVAGVASQIFGKEFKEGQIINECLIRCFGNSNSINKSDIIRVLSSEIPSDGDENVLKSYPLSIWIENEIALQEIDGFLVRRAPATLKEIVLKLKVYTDVDEPICREKLIHYLRWLADINSNLRNQKYSYLPFRIHQFISQTGSVYVTLEDSENRFITLNQIPYSEDDKKHLYPLVFSRMSGHEFICVHLNNQKIEPREFKEQFKDEESFTNGYIIPGGNDVWDPADIVELPDSWLKINNGGLVEINSKYQDRIPKRIYYSDSGDFSFKPDYEHSGWYMPSKLLFDPTSGTIYDPKTSEGTILSRLGSEGRSTSTTILTHSIIKHLGKFGYPIKEQKILSFTDNRQDAALQSGHFNDFVMVIKFRSAVYRTLAQYKQLTHSTIADKIFESIDLLPEEYLENPSDFPATRNQQEEVFRTYLFYLILDDLKRGWRIVLPNLEQCALLHFQYANLQENCSIQEAWKEVPFITEINSEKRAEILYQTLEYFRKSYALHSEYYLNPGRISENTKEIREKLKAPWTLDDNDKILTPTFMRYEPLHRNSKIYSSSIGYQSALGKYLRREASTTNQPISKSDYPEFIKLLMDKMVDAGWLKSTTARNRNNEQLSVYQLKIDSLIWCLGDEKTIYDDPVKKITYKTIDIKPNQYFQDLYKSDFKSIRPMSAREHTGQIKNDDRIEVEETFREGKLSTLFCSPTMELGIDIKSLNAVHMRNVPPNPANYAQRSGRAGRSGQTSIVFVNCSAYSPHDRHYFHHSTDMVAGVVIPPRIDLKNEELLITHLYAIYISKVGLSELNNSIFDILDDTRPDILPIKSIVESKLNISQSVTNEIVEIYKKILLQISTKTSNTGILYNEDWIRNQLKQAPIRFDNAINRWRKLYFAAKQQLLEANNVINSGLYTTNSQEMKNARRNQIQATIQIDILKNQVSKYSFSEFYPYRYLASEGFLPGYNFTRLPLRTWIPKSDSGEYISRSRFIALREFGPGNIVYHCGSKYKINQMIISEPEQKLKKAKVCTTSGYWMMGDEYDRETCPVTRVSLTENKNGEIFTDLLEMSETRTERMMSISCEEEDRMSRGYDTEVFFSVPAGIETIKKAIIRNESDEFIYLRYIPVAQLVQINKKWHISPEDGFLMGMRSGIWKKQSVLEKPEQSEEHKRVKLFTTDNADVLYIQPIKPLALEAEGVLTLQYALKQAIENIFQIETQELGVTLIGDSGNPNILIYESSEGSLGVLSQFMDDPATFNKVIVEAIKICRYDEPDYKDNASYDDLLSYYNQRDHKRINRFLIKDALEKLKICNVEIQANPAFQNYEEHYQHLLKSIDPTSETELKFLKYLYKNGFRLPDRAQKYVDGIYSQPDFFYNPDVHVFCDGTPHDDPSIKEHDEQVRQAIRNKGEQVIVYYYKDKLEDIVTKRPDIFKKVK